MHCGSKADSTSIPFAPSGTTVADGSEEIIRVKLFKHGVRRERERATYLDILNLGADNLHLHWLWRSRLADYDRHARVFQRWLGRTVLLRTRVQCDVGDKWNKGFEIYDAIDRCDRSILGGKPLESLSAFARRCDVLVAELRDATLGSNWPVHRS